MPKQTGSTTRLSSYKTTWHHDMLHGVGIVTYHTTRIVAWTPKEIILQTGGWDSVTTRRKMNQASEQFGLGFRVWRHKGTTWVDYKEPGAQWRTIPLERTTILPCRVPLVSKEG